MKNILIGIKNNALTFSYREKSLVNDKNLLNTNIITDNELIFSEQYIKSNTKIVISFVKELINQYKIKQVIIKESSLTNIVIDLINNNVNVKAIFFREETQLSFEICEKLLTNKNIKVINCYNMPPYMLECFDRKGVITESRSEIMFASKFMQENNLLQYSKIYYKMSVRIDIPLNEDDLKDFKIFCKINKYLKTIIVSKFQRSEVEKIIKILIENKLKNVRILIYDNISKESDFNQLKKLNRKYRRNKIKIKLKYSEEYIKDNIFKQIVLNVLKVCALITCFIIFTVVLYVGGVNIKSTKKVNVIIANIKDTVKNTDKDKLLEKLNENKTNDAKITNSYVASLLSINPETIGWLKVNGTNIDYPVVQTTNNSFYLDHNYEMKEDRDGWVSVDYRNSIKNLDKNTIIHAHNRYYSGVMFGTLYKAQYRSWYNKKANQIIKFDTLYDEMEWRIFSIYKIPVTNDYLEIKFYEDNEWSNFVKMLKDRSIHDFNVEVGEDDKILTLTTCSSPKDTRLVVHAVLIKK